MPLSRRSSPPTKTEPVAAAPARGSVAPLIAVHAAVAVSCCLAVARVGAHVVIGERAQAAADSVALACAVRNAHTAQVVADGLRARIVSITDLGNVVSVVVELSGTRRSATAARAVPAASPTGS